MRPITPINGLPSGWRPGQGRANPRGYEAVSAMRGKLEEHPEAVHVLASGAVSLYWGNPIAGAVIHTGWHLYRYIDDRFSKQPEADYQPSPDVFNQDPSKVNILSPVFERESTRRVPSSSQQGRRRGGTTSKKGSETVPVIWKIGGSVVDYRTKGGKKRPSCPRGFRLRRVGKRLMCVKS